MGTANTTGQHEIASDYPGGFPLQRTELLFIFAFWTVLAVLTAASRLIDPRGPVLRLSPSTPITLAFAESYLWAIFTVLIFWLSSQIGRAHV